MMNRIICHQCITFNKNTLSLLKKLVDEEQKEVSGVFKSKNKIGKNILEMYIQKNSFSFGVDDNVKSPNKHCTFHTHPKTTYKKYNVKYAWPSALDYKVLIRENGKLAFHLLATLEGIYLITINPGIKLPSLQNANSFIKKNLDISLNLQFTPRSYTTYINKYNLFKVIFKSWKSLEKENIFCISYSNGD